MFFHHEIIKKYTLSLLSTFNQIEIQTKLSNGVIKSNYVPIKFSTREKAVILDDYKTSDFVQGNYNVLPRMALTFEGMSPNRIRSTNKNHKINTNVNGQLIQYQNNSIPYDFQFNIILQARGMSEASSIVEQVASYFNPTYTLKINEIPIQSEPSTILLELGGITFENEDYEELSTNIVTINFPITLRGNIYPAIKESGLVDTLQMYINEYNDDNKYSRKTLLEWDGNNLDKSNLDPGITPEITDILIVNTYINNSVTTKELTLDFSDKDNKISPSEFTYIWNVLSGTATVTTGNYKVNLVGLTGAGDINVSVQVIDIHGNQSDLFQKTIII